MDGREIVEVPDRAAWRSWLAERHRQRDAIWLVFHKKASDGTSPSYEEAVEEALCFGWIDGVRRRIDDESYSIRFTPRRARSIWSNVNTKRFAELTKQGRVHAAGLAAFEKRDAKRSGGYSHEQREKAQKLDAVYAARLKANRKAWAFLQAQPPGYQRMASLFVMSAKREETRLKRLAVLIAESAAGRRIGLGTKIGSA